MFGVDEDKVDELQARRVRRRRRYKRLAVTTLELLFLIPLVLFTAGMWLFLTPDGLAFVLEKARPNADSELRVADIAIHPGSQLDDPRTWAVVFEQVDMIPKERFRPTVHFDRVVLGMPDLRLLYTKKQLYVREAWLIGMRIQAKQQRAAPKREPKENAIRLLRADTVHVWDASYDAPPDEPLPAAGVDGIFGTMTAVVFDPFSREVSGSASLFAQRFHTGTLFLHHIRIDSFEANKGDLTLSGGTLWWEGQQATVNGTILDIDTRAKVELLVRLRQARIEQMVQSATGEASPLMGSADVDLRVHSGGELPRGGGYMDAHVEVNGAILPLPKGTRGVYKDAVRLAPVARLDADDRVHLEHMVGDLTFRRGTVYLHELIYEARIPILLRGEIDATEMDLLVRVVPGGDPLLNPGLGLKLKGPLTTPQVSRATKDELLPGWREAREKAGKTGIRGWFKRKDKGDEDPDAPG